MLRLKEEIRSIFLGAMDAHQLEADGCLGCSPRRRIYRLQRKLTVIFLLTLCWLLRQYLNSEERLQRE